MRTNGLSRTLIQSAIVAVAMTAFQASGQRADYQSETATLRVPFLLDTTEAMLARDRLMPPPNGIQVIRNIFQITEDEREGKDGGKNPFQEIIPGKYFPGPSENGGTPGDPNMAAGPNHVIACINGSIRFYTKAGGLTFSVNPASFFSGLGVSLCCDCRCFYDPGSKRFFIMYLGFDGTNHSYYEVAVSDDDNPNGTWAKWVLNSSMNGTTLSNFWTDYPGFGYTSDTLIWTGNMFPISGSGNYGKIRIAGKQQFLDGSPTITYTDFWNFTNPAGGTAFSLQPGRTTGAANVPVVVNVSGTNRVNVFAIQNPLTAPALVKKSVTVSSFGGPSGGKQLGTTTKIDMLDSRVYDVNVRDNMILVTHNISGGAGSRVRWYELDGSNLPTSVTLVQQGNIEDPSYFTGYGSLNKNMYGTIGTGLTRTSATEHVGVYYTGREAGDAPGTMKPMTLKRIGVAYNGENSGATSRWGDYCGGALDPDDFTFWAIGMVPVSSGAWGTEIYAYTIGTPANLAGNIHLDSFVGSIIGQAATLEFRSPGTTNVLHSYPISLNAGGLYIIPAVAVGTFDLAIKFSHWLRTILPSVTFALGDNSVDFDTANGDADGDNVIDLFDVNAVFVVFDSTDPSGDLNGDKAVNLDDLNIALTRFGMAGPP